MKISLHWINDFVSLEGVDPKELSHRFTMTTAEVEGVEEFMPGMKDATAVRVDEVKKHPNADTLFLAKFISGGEEVEVVCGAPNTGKGLLTVYIPPGSVLPDGTKVKLAKVRGVYSAGMLAAGDELGISEDHNVIVDLSDTGLKEGDKLEGHLGFGSHVLEIDNKSLTHRPDLWSHYGIAREMAAMLGRDLEDLDTEVKIESAAEPIGVEIEDYDLCPRYAALVIENLEIAESPAWLQARLTMAGMRPVNNIVDITNYVMLEVGQPLHAFDGDHLAGDAIIVRRARGGEKIRTLDGADRELCEDDLVIADAEKPVAIAGVMGGESSEITSSTRRMVLESANFDAVSVRRTSARLKLRTEAVARFEKSLDPELPLAGIARFVKLLSRVCPEAKVVSRLYDAHGPAPEPVYVELDLERLNTLLGVEVLGEQAIGILKRLSFEVEDLGEKLRVKVPGFRATRDVSIPEDLVEEIGRIYGYNNIEPVMPLQPCAPPERDPMRDLFQEMREELSGACGMHEVWTHSFMRDPVLDKIGFKPDLCCELANPINQEETRMRTALLFNLLEVMEKNQRHSSDFEIFELGRTYHKLDEDGELPLERSGVCALLYRKRPENEIFFEARGALECLFEKMKIRSIEFRSIEGVSSRLEHGWSRESEGKDDLGSNRPWVSPGRALAVYAGGAPVGALYELHPRILSRLDVPGAAAVFELDLEALMAHRSDEIAYSPIPRYPSISFDTSLLVDEKVTWSEIEKTVTKNASKKFFESVEFNDLYKGEGIPAGRKSVNFKITFRAKNKTLSQKDADKFYSKLIAKLKSALNAEQR